MPEPDNCRYGCHIATEFVTIIYDRFPIIPIKTREKSWIPQKVFRLRKKFQWEERCRSSQKIQEREEMEWEFLGKIPENTKAGMEQNFPRSVYALFTVEPRSTNGQLSQRPLHPTVTIFVTSHTLDSARRYQP